MLVILIIVILCCLKHIQITKDWEFFLGYLQIFSPKVYEFYHGSFREKFHNFRSMSFRSLYFQEFVLSGVCLSGVCLSGVCLSGFCLSGVCLSGVCHGTKRRLLLIFWRVLILELLICLTFWTKSCTGCIMRRRNPDRPAVAMSMASDFNEKVSIDLKNGYILNSVDLWRRLTTAALITRKEPRQIKWTRLSQMGCILLSAILYTQW